jgi:hypothetical protein
MSAFSRLRITALAVTVGSLSVDNARPERRLVAHAPLDSQPGELQRDNVGLQQRKGNISRSKLSNSSPLSSLNYARS